MTTTLDFYLARAEAARADAAKADLANVRERNLRAAAAWDLMADRAARHERQRADQEARKAAELAQQAAKEPSSSVGSGMRQAALTEPWPVVMLKV